MIIGNDNINNFRANQLPGAAGGRYGSHLLKIKRLSIEQGDTKSGGNRLRSAESERSEQEEIYKISARKGKEITNTRAHHIANRHCVAERL